MIKLYNIKIETWVERNWKRVKEMDSSQQVQKEAFSLEALMMELEDNVPLVLRDRSEASIFRESNNKVLYRMPQLEKGYYDRSIISVYITVEPAQ